MKRMKKFVKTMKSRWQAVSVMVVILIFAGMMTIIRPFDPDSVSYFSDVITPLVTVGETSALIPEGPVGRATCALGGFSSS